MLLGTVFCEEWFFFIVMSEKRPIHIFVMSGAPDVDAFVNVTPITAACRYIYKSPVLIVLTDECTPNGSMYIHCTAVWYMYRSK